MSWQRPVSVFVLAIMAALPVSAALCTMLCESAPSSTTAASGHHHGSTQNTETNTGPSAEAQIHSLQHDCTSHDILRSASATAAQRADRSIASVPLATASAPATFKAFTEPTPLFEYDTPPRTAPPTTTPLVLRV